MSLNGKCASCEMYALAGSLGDILHTGEVCHVTIKTNCLLRSWENPAGFRTMSTALLIRDITVNSNQEGRTQHDFYMAAKCSHVLWWTEVIGYPAKKAGWTDSPISLVLFQCHGSKCSPF